MSFCRTWAWDRKPQASHFARLSLHPREKPMIYLDNSATTKPCAAAVDAIPAARVVPAARAVTAMTAAASTGARVAVPACPAGSLPMPPVTPPPSPRCPAAVSTSMTATTSPSAKSNCNPLRRPTGWRFSHNILFLHRFYKTFTPPRWQRPPRIHYNRNWYEPARGAG